MARTRRAFNAEQRVEAAHLVIDTDRTISAVAGETGIGEQLLGRWVRDERTRMAAAAPRDPVVDLNESERAELARLRRAVAEQSKRLADQEMDIAFLKKASAYFASNQLRRNGSPMIAAEYATQGCEFTLASMLRSSGVSGSGFHAWRNRQVGDGVLSAAAQTRRDRLAKVIAVHAEHRGRYGYRRVTAELRATGDPVNRKTIATIMAGHGLAGISPRTFYPPTTIVDTSAFTPPDLVGRRFDQGGADLVWGSDITYLTTGEGEVFLCAVRDLHSRRVLGWAAADHMRTELVIHALDNAVTERGGIASGVVFHADRGCQFTAGATAEYCKKRSIRQSVGRTGVCWDNAPSESFWSIFKHEFYKRHVFRTRAELYAAIEDYIGYYNHDRRNSTIGYHTPASWETRSADQARAA